MPALSVIIPCYNTAPDILADTLAALRRSTFQEFELVLVDDGSTDLRWLDVLRDYFPAARVVRHPANRGLAAARNTGAAACAAPLFLQLDADDQVEPTFLEKALWALASHPEWSFVNAWHRAFGGRSYAWTKGFEQQRAYLYLNQSIPAAVIRTAADRAIGGHDESIRAGNEDWDYWLKMAAHGFWGGTLPEFLLRYRTYAPPTFWPNRDDPVRLAQFRAELRRRYPALWRRRGWPDPARGDPPHTPAADLPDYAAPSAADVPPEKRLLLLIPWMTLGGADRFNLMLLELLRGRGFAVTVCATADGPSPWLDKFQALTADIFILCNFLRREDYPRFLRRLIRSRSIGTVLLSASQLGYGLLPYLRAHSPQTALLDYVHMVDLRWRDGGYARAAVNAQPALDLSLVSSRQVRDWMTAQGADPERIAVCPINVDSSLWDPARFDRAQLRRGLKLPGDEPVILFAARLAPQKRPRLLLEILAALRARGRRFTALVAGDGPQLEWVQRRAARPDLRDCVRVLGAVEPERMPELMAASDLFLLPSQDEGIAVTLYEAMAMELGVVAADVGGQRELVTPETGRLIPPGAREADRYVAALVQLLDDPGARLALGRAARMRVREHFSAGQLTERLSTLVERAHEFRRTAPRSAPGLAQAEAVAAQVIEAEQRLALSAQIFAEGTGDFALGPARPHPGWRQRLARALKAGLVYPMYNWGLEQGWEWLVPLKNRMYRLAARWRRT